MARKFWATVSIRYDLLEQLHAIYAKTGNADDKPTRVIDSLVRAHLKKTGKEIDIEKALEDYRKEL